MAVDHVLEDLMGKLGKLSEILQNYFADNCFLLSKNSRGNLHCFEII